MTTYSIAEIAGFWEAAGGPAAQVVNAVAIAMAESGGQSDIVSPSLDYGLWQINIGHFGDGIISGVNWSSPGVNAAEAVSIYNGGYGWGAWCTAWANPAANCASGYLAAPQAGSAAYGWLVAVETILGVASITAPPTLPNQPVYVDTTGEQEAMDAWWDNANYLNSILPARQSNLIMINQILISQLGVT